VAPAARKQTKGAAGGTVGGVVKAGHKRAGLVPQAPLDLAAAGALGLEPEQGLGLLRLVLVLTSRLAFAEAGSREQEDGRILIRLQSGERGHVQLDGCCGAELGTVNCGGQGGEGGL